MGADWFEPSIYLGICFETKQVLQFFKALRSSKLPFSLGYLEHSTHSRTECESSKAYLERCSGFLGVCVDNTTLLEDLPLLRATISKYLEENKELFGGITQQVGLHVGELHEVCEYDLNDEDDEDDEDSDDDD